MEFEYKGLDGVLPKPSETQVDFKRDQFVIAFSRVGLILLLVQLGFLIVNLKILPSEVPLFYSLSWGEKRLADYRFLFLLPLFSIFIMIFNFLVSKKLYNNERLLSRMIASIAFIFVVFCLITLLQIIYIVT